MSTTKSSMDDLEEEDLAVLESMADGRANPYLIRERTDINKGDVNTILNRLARRGYVIQVTRGLYDITDRGRDKLSE